MRYKPPRPSSTLPQSGFEVIYERIPQGVA